MQNDASEMESRTQRPKNVHLDALLSYNEIQRPPNGFLHFILFLLLLLADLYREIFTHY